MFKFENYFNLNKYIQIISFIKTIKKWDLKIQKIQLLKKFKIKS
jgi:hypothetical protein